MMGFVSASLLLVFSCLHAVNGDSGFSYASYYESHMVLQRAPLRASIWGYAPVTDIGSKVTVNISATLIQTLTFTTTVQPGVDPQRATWKITFPPLVITSPCTVSAVLSNYQPIVLNDVLFGDVWVCSGQSNMKFTVSQIFGAAEVAAEAARYANAIRFFSVGQVESQKPLHDFQNIEIHWSVPEKSTVWPFSAVCWLYAKNIYDTRGVPMGLIESSWGGTNIEAWSSPECLHVCHITEQQPSNETKWLSIQRLSLQLDNTVIDTPTYQFVPDTNNPINAANSVLWNAMINPILNMTIFGVIWYQGEANTDYNRDIYNCTFPAMISDWRRQWFAATNGLTNVVFPFGFVQIGPTDGKPAIAGYADVRWHQTADFGFTPNDDLENVFMAVSVDLTDFDVHFRDKITASRRLALSGLAVAYKLDGLRYQGPWVTMVVLQVQKRLLTLNYDYNKYPIAVKNTTGFEICCRPEGCAMDSDNWFAAPVIPPTTASFTFSATLDASLCPDLKLASALRYAWRETPFSYLSAAIYSVDYNLPAPPFIMYHREGTNKWYHGKSPLYVHDKL